MAVLSSSYPLRPHRVTWIKTKREGVYVKSGRSGALKPGKLGLGCEANKCSDAGTGDLGVLPTHETSSMQMSIIRTTHLATAILVNAW